MKHFLIIIATFTIPAFALVQSDREAKEFFKNQGAGHGDFIESADTLIIDSNRITPKGSHCIGLPINGNIKNHQISCLKGAKADSSAFPGKIVIKSLKLPLCAVRIKQTLYIGQSFKEIANEMLRKKLH